MATLRAVAGEFSAACNEVNERLGQCGEWLHKGLRGEALQLCETEPNLLEAVALLDFAELEPWRQLLAQHGLEVPAPPKLDVATQLNEAYAVQQPLETILQQHRRQALARSPLSARIGTLQRLASLDADNPVWRKDLQHFEDERLKQIEREIGEAFRQSDVARLANLEKELCEDRGVSPLAESLAASAAAARQEIVVRIARMNLERISSQLVLAFNGKDEAKARSLFSEWQVHAGQCPLAPGDPLYERTAGVLAWLAECDAGAARLRAYEEAVQTLEQSLQGGSLAALTSAYAKATQGGYPISPSLEHRYRTRAKELRRIAGKRRVRYVLAGAVLLAVVGVLVVRGITQQMFRWQVDRQAATVAALIESDPAEAEAYLERLEREWPAVAREERIETLRGQLQERKRAGADRKKAFDSLLSRIDGELGDDPERASLPEAATGVESAGKLAVTSVEKERVEARRAALAEARAKVQHSIDVRFLDKLAPLEKAAENLSPDDPDTLFAVAAKLREDVRKVESDAAGVSDAARGRLKPLYACIDTAEHDAREESHQQAALRLLTLAVGNAQLFKARLAAYATEFPQSARSPSFLQAGQEAPLWEGLEKWNQLGQEWQTKDLAQLEPATAKDLAERASAALSDYGNYPEAEAFRKRIPFLRAIAQRAEADPPAARRIRELFSVPVMHLEMIRDTGERRYYLPTAPPPPEHITTVKYVKDFTMSLGAIRISKETMKFAGPSPQALLVPATMKLINQLTNDNWESVFFQILCAINQQADLDPLLKAVLLKEVLDVGCQGSYCLKSEFQRHIDALSGTSASVNWLDPENPEVDSARKAATDLLDSLPDWKEAANRAASRLRELRQAPGNRYQWAGWLRKGLSGGWRCDVPSLSTMPDGDLFIIRHGASGQAGVVTDRVGERKGGLSQIDAAAGATALLEGRPVYVVRSGAR